MAVQKFYLVHEDVFEKCYQKIPTLSEKISQLAPKARQKAKVLAGYLSGLVDFDEFGRTKSYKHNIFDYIVYAIKGKDQPIDWILFVPLLIEAPKEALTSQAKREVRQVRKHGA